ncbi:MAG: hypothetical protein HQ498_07125 [Pseudohongiella sp.]|nr:hypothetical protein [Pseudohongiella sp.]
MAHGFKTGGRPVGTPKTAPHCAKGWRLITLIMTGWLWTYNHEQSNMTLASITPKQKLAMVA